MKRNLQKGFTLIELLVVVAIIGILSSIVLVSLNSARQKGRDASAKGSISSIRAAAEIYYDSLNDYGPAGAVTIAGTDTGTGAEVSDATNICDYEQVVDLAAAASRQTGLPVNCNVTFGPAGYTIHAVLNDGQTFCVDANGYSGYLTDPVDGAQFSTPLVLGRGCIQ